MVCRLDLRRALLAMLLLLWTVPIARAAQTEIPPPQGKGRVVVVISGQSGAERYKAPAEQIAGFGYDVILLDGNDLEGSHGQALREAVQAASTSAHGLPGKVGVVGFSLGGGEALAYATRWPDLVAGVVVWYPATMAIQHAADFASGIKVPVLMFAGESDHYKNCCLIDTARALAAAASAGGKPLDLVTYPRTQHDFIFRGSDYNADATADSWERARARLAQYLGH